MRLFLLKISGDGDGVLIDKEPGGLSCEERRTLEERPI